MLLKDLLRAVILVALLPCFGIAQSKTTTQAPSTKLEEFLATKGKLLVKELTNLGELKGNYGGSIVFRAIRLFEPGREAESLKGIKIVISVDGGKSYNKEENFAFLDKEEINDLSKALDYVIKLLPQWEAYEKGYTEVIFSTRGDFRI